MHTRQISQVCSAGSFFLLLGLLLLTACGSNPASGSTAAAPSGAQATATACARLTRPAAANRTAIGMLKQISGQTLQLTTQRGATVTVTYTSATRFTRETTLPASSLQEGTPVRVVVTRSAGSYTATSIVVTSTTATGLPGFPRAGGTPGAGRGAAACFTRARGNGTPGAGATNFRGLLGTVSHLNGTTLTITDSAGADFTVTLTAQTQIIETMSSTATALKVGQALTVTGRAASQGSIQASLVAILLVVPTRLATPTTIP
jgi:hypothetical protein